MIHICRIPGANGIDGLKSGEYRKALPNDWAWAVIACPKCGLPSTLSRKIHSVSKDGIVSPSYVCPHKHVKCDFHAFVVLDGWKDV